MIDSEGYRPNVGIILCNANRRLFWARRIGQHSWQFPQGGIRPDELPEQAMFRELAEEVGLRPEHVQVIGCTRGWLRYRLPKRLIRPGNQPACIGQKQIWFLLRMVGSEDAVCLDASEHPEFDHWQWVDYWYPLRAVVPFKRHVYWHALRELAPLVFPCRPPRRLSPARRKDTVFSDRLIHRGVGFDHPLAANRSREATLEVALTVAHAPESVQAIPPTKPMAILPLRRMDIRHHPVITRMVVSTRRSEVNDIPSVVATPVRESPSIPILDEPCLPHPSTPHSRRFFQR